MRDDGRVPCHRCDRDINDGAPAGTRRRRRRCVSCLDLLCSECCVQQQGSTKCLECALRHAPARRVFLDDHCQNPKPSNVQ